MADILESLGRKITQTSQDAIQKTRDLAEITKLNGRIAEEEKKIQEGLLQIGRVYFSKYENNPEESLRGVVLQIKAAQDMVIKCQEEIRQLKRVITCVNCGADLSVGSSFCSMCGSQVQNAAQPRPGFAEITCTNCGNPLKGEDVFCTACGTKAVRQSVTAAMTEPEAASVPIIAAEPEPVPVQVVEAEPELEPTQIMEPEAQPAIEPEQQWVDAQFGCPECGKKLKAGLRFCTGCGTKLNLSSPLPVITESDEINCPACGRVLKTDTKFCTGCGQKVSEQSVS